LTNGHKFCISVAVLQVKITAQVGAKLCKYKLLFVDFAV